LLLLSLFFSNSIVKYSFILFFDAGRYLTHLPHKAFKFFVGVWRGRRG